MPKLDKIFTLEVTPEQFLRNCSQSELIETDLLLQASYYQRKMARNSMTKIGAELETLNLKPETHLS